MPSFASPFSELHPQHISSGWAANHTTLNIHPPPAAAEILLTGEGVLEPNCPMPNAVFHTQHVTVNAGEFNGGVRTSNAYCLQ